MGKCFCQLTSPLPPSSVTLCISNRKNTNSPICFITQRINMKWWSLLSCCTCKPAHYSASNKHLLRVNKSSSWLSLCRECPGILGNLSLRKKKLNILIFYSCLRIPGTKISRDLKTWRKPRQKGSYFFISNVTFWILSQNGTNITAMSFSSSGH